MNLEKLFPVFFFLCLGIGALIGYLRGEATATGAAIGVAVGISPIFVLGAIYGLLILWQPEKPKCMCGNAKLSDYVYLNQLSKRRDDGYCYGCRKCGREYLLQTGRFDLRLSENEFQPYMEISKWGRWRRNENGAMFSVSVNNNYTVLCEDNSLPDIYADYRQNAKVVEEFDLDNSDDVLCFIGVQRDSAWPFLVIAQRYSPGFDPEALLVEETDVLFIGAGERLLAYDIRRSVRLWEDEAEMGFWDWSRHDSAVVMSAELELAGWNLSVLRG